MDGIGCGKKNKNITKTSPNAPYMDYLPTLCESNGHMNKGKWLDTYSRPLPIQ